MPFLFSHVEYCDMHYVYGYCNGNANAAVNEYRRRYPERRIPSKRVFTLVEQALRDNGCLPSFALHSEREIVRTINTRENILDMVQRSPRLSTRRMASRVGLSRMNVWRTLHEENLYPYHDQRVQHLEPGDHAQCMDLCHCVNAHPELLNVILFTDEASFTRDGINNLRNVHTWAHRNPHATCVTHFQRRFYLNVWCGMLGNRLIGYFVFDNNLTGNIYEAFLKNELPRDMKFSVTILLQPFLKPLSKYVMRLCSPGIHEGKSNIKMYIQTIFIVKLKAKPTTNVCGI